MAHDDVRPEDEPHREVGSIPPTTVTGHPLTAAASTPIADDADVPGSPDAAHGTPIAEPSMASASADLAGAGRSPEPFASTVAAASAPPKRSMMPALLAAIGLVLIALLAINLYLMINPPGESALASVQAQAAGLDHRIAMLEQKPAPTVDLSPLDARVKALSAKVDQLAAGTAAASAAVPAELSAIGGRTDALGKALNTLKQQVATIPRPDLAPLDAKVAGLAAGLSSTKADLISAKAELASTKADVVSAKAELTPLPAALAALDHRLTPIETEFSAPKIATYVTEARQVGSAAETRAAPLAVTAQSILQAIDAGKPFAPQLAALQTLDADQAQVAVLRPLADKGAPTKDALIAGFAAVREKMIVDAAPVQTGTMFDRMMASAQSVVKVRPAGASPGNDADAVISRIEADLAAGDLKAALAEWDKLPDASKAPSATWAEQLRARVTAESTARSIAAGAIAALGQTQ